MCVCGVRRLDNLIYSSPEATQVVAVLDWELSTLGDPVSDLAYVCMPYHMDPDQPQLKGERERGKNLQVSDSVNSEPSEAKVKHTEIPSLLLGATAHSKSIQLLYSRDTHPLDSEKWSNTVLTHKMFQVCSDHAILQSVSLSHMLCVQVWWVWT